MTLSNPVPHYVAAAMSTGGLICGAYFAYRFYQERKNKLPDQWTHVGHLKSLYVYPIKSCAPVILNQAECTTLGMRNGWLRDRILVVVNEKDNGFISARTYPQLLMVKPSLQNAILTLEHPDMEKIQVNLAEVMVTQKPIEAFVWEAPVSVYDCGDEVNKWITKILNQPGESFRLVYYASQNSRPLAGKQRINAKKIFTKWRKTDTGAMPDQLAFNLVNEASVVDLNSRLKDVQVSEKNFRPNMLLSGAEAYDEDNWKYVKVGENIFEVVKPCTRCILTCIDPATGERNLGQEPLKTLRSYRMDQDPVIRAAIGMSPRMGVQMALRSGPGGIVSNNDPIYVSY